jgi:hypothetical protein
MNSIGVKEYLLHIWSLKNTKMPASGLEKLKVSISSRAYREIVKIDFL